jgi:hypothetical protein
MAAAVLFRTEETVQGASPTRTATAFKFAGFFLSGNVYLAKIKSALYPPERRWRVQWNAITWTARSGELREPIVGETKRKVEPIAATRQPPAAPVCWRKRPKSNAKIPLLQSVSAKTFRGLVRDLNQFLISTWQ